MLPMRASRTLRSLSRVPFKASHPHYVFGQHVRALSVESKWRGTTILSVRKNDSVAVVGDGQISMGNMVVKPNAKKVRRLGPEDMVIAGFAGATADALTLFERLESKIDEHPDQLLRACVSLAKEWRMDKYLRRLDAVLLVCDRNISLQVTGTGDVLEPSADGIIGIGSGSAFAIAAARALVPIPNMSAEEIAQKSLEIAADLCVYTNRNLIVETINYSPEKEPSSSSE